MLEFFDILGIRDFLDNLLCLINTRIAHDLIFLFFFFVNKNGGIISLWCELFTIFIFVLLTVLSFISDIFYPDDDICKY